MGPVEGAVAIVTGGVSGIGAACAATLAVPWFTAQYGVDRLVWFEYQDKLKAAMLRAHRIKGWKRIWKIQLIEKDNPHWIDRYPELCK